MLAIISIVAIGQYKRDRLSPVDGELAHGCEIFATQRCDCLQFNCIRASLGADTPFSTRHPWHLLPVVESKREHASHRDTTLKPSHNPDNMRMRSPYRHEVDNLHAAAIFQLMGCFQD